MMEVFPAPRKPVNTVIGIGLESMQGSLEVVTYVSSD